MIADDDTDDPVNVERCRGFDASEAPAIIAGFYVCPGCQRRVRDVDVLGHRKSKEAARG